MAVLDVLIVLVIGAAAFLIIKAISKSGAQVKQAQAKGSHSEDGSYAPDGRGQGRSPDAIWERASLARLTKGDLKPDAILRCIVQTTGESAGAEFTDILVGAFKTGRFVRFVMRDDDEPDYDPETDLHSWDVPFSEIFAVILRERTTPGYPLKSPGPDGRYISNKRYKQTRVLRVGRGMEVRLLDSDAQTGARPFGWLRDQVDDPAIFFGNDTQEDPLYGDTAANGDRLDEYVIDLGARSDAAADRAFAERASMLSADEIEAAKARGSEEVRTYLDSSECSSDFERWFGFARDQVGFELSRPVKEYTKHVFRLVMLKLIPKNYWGIFMYDHFPNVFGSSSHPVGKSKEGAAIVLSYARAKFSSI